MNRSKGSSSRRTFLRLAALLLPAGALLGSLPGVRAAARPRKLYLAGPDVFRADAVAHGEALKALCARYGFEGLYPLDNALPKQLAEPREQAAWIYRANIGLIERADAVLANLNFFRGAEPDSGTAFEAVACAQCLERFAVGDGVGAEHVGTGQIEFPRSGRGAYARQAAEQGAGGQQQGRQAQEGTTAAGTVGSAHRMLPPGCRTPRAGAVVVRGLWAASDMPGGAYLSADRRRLACFFRRSARALQAFPPSSSARRRRASRGPPATSREGTASIRFNGRPKPSSCKPSRSSPGCSPSHSGADRKSTRLNSSH